MHADNCGYQFNWENVEILNRGSSKNDRDFLESWNSDQLVKNKYNDIDSIYQLTQKDPKNHTTRGQVNRT